MEEPASSRPAPGELDLESVFPGDGEMARLMRRFDWAATPLGPVSSWPQSLRTSISILLKSRHPMFLWWGEELIQLYNDGYRPSLGAHKHPRALGQRGRECWDEIWPIIGPQIEGVMSRGEETWHEDQLVPFDRSGFLEEIYFTYSYSPIHDESGGVGGTLVVCSETTERVLGERRLRTLSDLSSAAAEVKTEAETCARALAVLAENPWDLPCALLYRIDGEGGEARLVGTVGLGDEPDPALAPPTIDLAAADAPWSLAAVLAGDAPVVVENLAARFPAGTAGPWPERPHTAVALPVASPGLTATAGVLVVAISPRLALDQGYRDFLRLVAAQLAAAVASARAYDAERRRAEALAELDRAKNDFFSNVSHEFRTPLTLILGPIEEALAGAGPALAGDALATVHRNALRLLRLVNHLLDFSRLEARRFEARYEPVDLAAVTAELAGSFRSLMERAGLGFEVDCPSLGEPVYVDREAWEKIVLNLLSNAFKFTREGGVEVRLRDRGERVELIVRDTGIGVPEDELPRLFERFHRVRDARGRTHEGSGIGLALVRELVERHGGEITADSVVGRGTIFTVGLPAGCGHLPAEQLVPAGTVESTAGARPFIEEASRWLPDPTPTPATTPPADDADVPDAEPAPRVLLADDNRDMRDYLVRLLGQDFRVTAVADGTAALERLRREPFDLVVSDVMMPGLDGVELLAALRADAVLREIPVILLSARAGEESRIEGLGAGADDYVVKPFSARELVARVRAQLGLARLRATTESQRRQLYELFQRAPASISILRGPELVFDYVNERFYDFVGRREAIGKPLREAVPEIEHQGLIDLVSNVFESGETYVGQEVPAELDRRGDGRLERRYFNFVLQPFHGLEGEVEGVATFGFDVTELVEARQEMERLAAAARLETRRKDEFLAMLGHELRNPLAPITSALALLKTGPEAADEERRQWALEVIDRQLLKMSRLIDDLLDVARITRGTVRLRKRRLRLAEVIEDAVETVRPLVSERRLELAVELPREPVWLDADAARLSQVVANLLNNAAKYTGEGGHVRLTATAAGDECTIEVADDGIGIDAESLPHVFELFTQIDPALDRSAGGLGIGLTVVRRLVELHGGRVDAHSEGADRGSRFVVTLPRVSAPTRRSSDRDERPEPSGDGLRVLVVDDNRDAAHSLATLLELHGHRVETALEGEGALAAARRLRPEVVLLDLGLPGIDGFEVARRLRAAHGAQPLLVALTGYGREVDRQRARDAGFDHHLLKPANVEQLEHVLAEPESFRGRLTGAPPRARS